MTLLAGCVIANGRRSSAERERQTSATNMESSEVVADTTDVDGDPPRCRLQATASPSPSRVAGDVDDLQIGNGSSLSPTGEPETAPTTRPERPASPFAVRDSKVPVLSFSVAAIMAKSTPSSSPSHQPCAPSASVELNHSDDHHSRHRRHRPRHDCPVSPRRASAFTVDGILNGVRRTSSSRSADDGDDNSSCSAGDDSESNRSSSPGVTRSFAVPPSTAAVTARQNLPFLHPAASSAIDVACKWPPAGCPYPWQYAHSPSESLLYICLYFIITGLRFV